ncbi:MAG TPA: DUF997 family protein [Gemmataceae bacterium]|jgi:hypothetical protein|nr:DUF997 family protein [Gemmataceae bacterium]
MTTPPNSPDKEQQLLQHARREGLLIMAVWAACLIWSMTVGYFMGYRRSAADISLILGIPDWIFWSVVLPWALCLAFSVWFCFAFMADDDLGQDQESRDD